MSYAFDSAAIVFCFFFFSDGYGVFYLALFKFLTHFFFLDGLVLIMSFPAKHAQRALIFVTKSLWGLWCRFIAFCY